MSRLEGLIQKLCPDGVKYKKLGSICDIISGFPFDSTKFTDNGIRLMRGMNVKRGYFDFSESSNRYWKDDINLEKYNLQANDIVIAMDGIVGSSLGFVLEEQLPLLLVQRVARVRAGSREEARFIYHYISGPEFVKYIDKRKTKGTIPHITLKDISEFKIPVPPLEVQSEIVRILDNFTELTAELTAELIARKLQYEYYRDKLLTCDDIGEVREISLIQLFDIKGGYTPSKKNIQYWESGTIPWFKMEDIRENGRILSDSLQKVDSTAVKGKLFPANSIILSTSATIGEHALITVPSLANQRFTYFSLKAEYAGEINMKYIYYYFFIIDEWCKKNVNQGNFASVDMGRLERFKIIIPPLNIQNEIVSVLDNFEELNSDLTSGLPAEIEARQKQYEYYRDKLLTFKEKSAQAG